MIQYYIVVIVPIVSPTIWSEIGSKSNSYSIFFVFVHTKAYIMWFY